MKLSKKSEYAVRALIEMALRFEVESGWYQISQIAEATQIPEKFLEQILLNLKHAGYLTSRRGIDGGYSLKKTPETILLDEVIHLLEGVPQLSPDQKNREDIASTVFYEIIEEAEQACQDVLRSKSLSDLVQTVKERKKTGSDCIEYQI